MGRGRHSSVDFSNCEDGSFPAFQGEGCRHTKGSEAQERTTGPADWKVVWFCARGHAGRSGVK